MLTSRRKEEGEEEKGEKVQA